MKRLDAKGFLFDQIIAGRLSAGDYYTCGSSFALRLHQLRNEQFAVPSETWNERFQKRLSDLRAWLEGNKSVDARRAELYYQDLETLAGARKADPDWATTQKVTRDIDTHSFNGVYKKNSFFLLDSYPPKNDWLFGHELVAPYRFATDIWAFSGEKDYFEAFLDGYESGSTQKLNRTDEPIFVFYAALIMWVYLYNLAESDKDKLVLAEKYGTFLARYHDEYIAPAITRSSTQKA